MWQPRQLLLFGALALGPLTAAQAQLACETTQITDTTGGASFRPSLEGGAIAFDSDADLTGGNADGNFEIFLSSCASPTAVPTAVPAVNPSRLAVLMVVLLLAGWFGLRRVRR